MEFVDTHCHIHSADYPLDPAAVIARATEAGVTRLICVGTDVEDSERAVSFVQKQPHCWASMGIHPHEAKRYADNRQAAAKFESLVTKPKVVAVGECGLDYYYNHSPKKAQREILELQLRLAQKHDLPLIFHVREAFDDFFALYDQCKGLKGVIHSFTADIATLDKILSRGLYIGLNGIMTFTKDESQLAMAKALPLQKLLLETDAPFLTPVPFRGKVCESKHVVVTAEFLSSLRGETLEELSTQTTLNARNLLQLL